MFNLFGDCLDCIDNRGSSCTCWSLGEEAGQSVQPLVPFPRWAPHLPMSLYFAHGSMCVPYHMQFISVMFMPYTSTCSQTPQGSHWWQCCQEWEQRRSGEHKHLYTSSFCPHPHCASHTLTLCTPTTPSLDLHTPIAPLMCFPHPSPHTLSPSHPFPHPPSQLTVNVESVEVYLESERVDTAPGHPVLALTVTAALQLYEWSGDVSPNCVYTYFCCSIQFQSAL